jgi:hypothetical protein
VVEGSNWESEQENDPVPLPNEQVESAIVGVVCVALQQIPRVTIGDPPHTETLPPLVAVLAKMLETEEVVRVGTTKAANVVNVTTFPYDVPAELVAKALM